MHPSPGRITLRITVVLVCGLAALVIASMASGGPSAIAGTITITGSGTQWTLTVQNASTSSGPIRCWRYSFPPGVFALAFGKLPPGWQVGGSKEASPPIITGRSGAGIPPGGTTAFLIVTNQPFDTDAQPGAAKVSSNCKTDTTAKVTFSDTAPTPTAPKCKCTALDVSTRAVVIGRRAWRLTADWALRCSGEAGKGCTGELKGFRWVGHPDIKVTNPKATVSCAGKCGKKPSKGSVRISGTAPTGAFSTSSRAGHTYHFTFGSYCNGRLSKRFDLSVVFNAQGRLDRKKSDLNANRVPDGREKKGK